MSFEQVYIHKCDSNSSFSLSDLLLMSGNQNPIIKQIYSNSSYVREISDSLQTKHLVFIDFMVSLWFCVCVHGISNEKDTKKHFVPSSE